MTPLLAVPPLKVSSGPWHDNRQQQIDTQNMGNLARQMDCKQGHHPVKHLQVAFKTGLSRRGDVQSQIANLGPLLAGQLKKESTVQKC